MNIRFFAPITFLAIISGAISATVVGRTHQQPKPILFIDSSNAFPCIDSLPQESDKSEVSNEWIYLRNRLGEMNKDTVRERTNSRAHKEYIALSNQLKKLHEKFAEVAQNIAKRRGAGALLEKAACGTNAYVDPSCDITNETIQELNKSYSPQAISGHFKTAKRSSPQDMLHEAILNNSSKEIRNAIQSGASIDVGKAGKPPLFWAITFKKPTAIKYLLECGANIDESFIQLAINQGDVKSAILFAEKCNLNIETTYPIDHLKGTLLQIAATHHDWKSVLLLVKKGANFSCNIINRGQTTLMDAVVHWCSETQIQQTSA